MSRLPDGLDKDNLKLTEEQANRFASDWLKAKLSEIKAIVEEIEEKLA